MMCADRFDLISGHRNKRHPWDPHQFLNCWIGIIPAVEHSVEVAGTQTLCQFTVGHAFDLNVTKREPESLQTHPCCELSRASGGSREYTLAAEIDNILDVTGPGGKQMQRRCVETGNSP